MAARFVRDEEVVGSNPATPTVKHQVKGLILARIRPLLLLWTSFGRRVGARLGQVAS